MPHQATILLTQQCFLLLVTAIFGGVFARRVRVPAVVGELLAGVLLGPSLLGAVAPDLSSRLFPSAADAPAVAAGREAILRFGLLLFVFVAGREMRLSRARGRAVAGASIGGFLLPFVLGAGAVVAAPGLFGQSPTPTAAQLPLFVGTALAISALPVIARILLDVGLIRHPVGATALVAATFDDMAGWVVFSILILDGSEGSGGVSPSLGALAAPVAAVAASALLLAWGRPLLRRHVLPRLSAGPPPLYLSVATALALLLASLAEAAGLHAVFGGFAAGVLFAPPAEAEAAGDGDRDRDPLAAVALGVFAPIYFVAAGMKADFVRAFDAPLVALVLALACVGKVAGVWAGARLGGMQTRESLAVAFAMNARGAMEILLASLALEAGLIDERLYVALIVTAIVTSVMAGPILRRLTRPQPPGGDLSGPPATAGAGAPPPPDPADPAPRSSAEPPTAVP